MAKHIIQIVITGAQIVGRAFVRAVRQEIQSSQQAANARRNATGSTSKGAATNAFTGLSVQEARQILNIQDNATSEEILKNYEHLFSVNEKSKGGSFYLQSKVFRAKERLDLEQKQQDNSEPEQHSASQKT